MTPFPTPFRILARNAILAMLLCLPFAGVAGAQTENTTGLMWNRSGLPAVFPLQVKTAPGYDYRVTLFESETGEAALAAFINGGDFFKVLVPPGTYILNFDYGKDWQGEAEGFARDQGQFSLDDPLSFEIRGTDRKAGHVVDLTEFKPGQRVMAEIRQQSICQTLRTDITPRYAGPARLDLDESRGARRRELFDIEVTRIGPLELLPPDWSDYPSVTTQARFCD